MGLCRRGHGQFGGRQCGVCKAAWEKARRPRRGVGANVKRAELRAGAYRFGKVAPVGRPVYLSKAILNTVRADRACKVCGAPTSWGSCSLSQTLHPTG